MSTKWVSGDRSKHVTTSHMRYYKNMHYIRSHVCHRERTSVICDCIVGFRFGENKGSYCTLASFKDGSSDTSHQGVLHIDEALQLEQQHKLSESLRLQPSSSATAATMRRMRCKPCVMTTRGVKTGGNILGSQARAYHTKRWLHAAAPSGTSYIKYPYSGITHNPADRLHWVRGVDLVKA